MLLSHIIVTSTLAIYSLALIAQSGTGTAMNISAEKQIDLQINRLVANVNPKELLDPSFPKEKINDQLRHFTGQYEINVVRKGPIQISGSVADVPVHIIFNTSVGGSSEQRFECDRNLDFVLRGDQWYFANYNFLNLTPNEYLSDLGLFLIAIIWLCGTWIKFNKLRANRIGGAFIPGLVSDYFRALNPLTWWARGQDLKEPK